MKSNRVKGAGRMPAARNLVALSAVALVAASAPAQAQDAGPRAKIELGQLERGRPSLKLEVDGRAVEIPARGEGTRIVSLTLRTGTIRVARWMRRARRVRFTVVITDVAGRRTTRRVTARPGD